ncbi:DNA repair protein RecO [Desulfatiferula olefinivorans]
MTSHREDGLLYRTPAIVLRKVEVGDHDMMLTLLTRERGKISVMAKNARKSVKRFSGVLELFYLLDVVIRENNRTAYAVEASVENPFEAIRSDVMRLAYAGYWAEAVIRFMEEKVRQDGLFSLMVLSLGGLDAGMRPPEEWSIFFHLKFLALTGHTPELSHCLACRMDLDRSGLQRWRFDIRQGGLICDRCANDGALRVVLSKGTLKQLLWFQQSEPEKARVVRFSRQALSEGLSFLETFLAFHLDKDLSSLKFLNKLRDHTR